MLGYSKKCKNARQINKQCSDDIREEITKLNSSYALLCFLLDKD